MSKLLYIGGYKYGSAYSLLLQEKVASEMTDEEKNINVSFSSPTILQSKMVPPPRWGVFEIT